MAPSIDEFEDLTQFADESFDTGEVDLFEFADDEDSPLLRLKSIVLSLDWDITEEILNELNEELANLRNLWKEDKVAQIYLQGMENVGKYMRTEGAYAHPNAIKLLLTLYYNFEKIISSPNISGTSVTSMLKADIRKFKVLQYQISALRKSKGETATEGVEKAEEPASPPKRKKGAEEAAAPLSAKKKDSGMPPPLRSMEATILGLEWEVTDEGLEKFSAEAAELRKHLSGHSEAQVLIQGLQALGAYIREQKTDSHPDAFTILHSFYDALKMLLDSPDLGAAQRRQILIEQISSLNSLKEVIARSASSTTTEDEAPETAEEAEDSEELPMPEVSKEKKLPSRGTGEAPAAAVKKESLAPPPVPPAISKPAGNDADDEDEFDDDLFSEDASGGVKPALADENEEGGFSGSLTSTGISDERAAELDEKLDSFFNFGDEDEFEKAAADAKKAEKLSLATIIEEEESKEEPEDEDDEIDASFFNFDDEEETATAAASNKFDVSESPAPAVVLEEEGELAQEAGHQDDELQDFFNFADGLEEEVAAPLSADSKDDEPSSSLASGLFGDLQEEEEQQHEAAVVAALPDTDEEQRSVSTDEDEDKLGSDLDSFFSFDEEPEELSTARPALAVAQDDDEDEQGAPGLTSGLFGDLQEEAEEEDAVVKAALPDADEDQSSASTDADEDELGADLDSFFSFDEETEKLPAAQPAAAVAKDDEDEQGTPGLFSDFFEEAEEAAQDKSSQPAGEKIAAAVEIDTERAAEIKNKLDTFFTFDDELLSHEAVTSADELEEEVPELADELITSADDHEEPLDRSGAEAAHYTEASFEDDGSLFGADKADSQDDAFFTFDSMDEADEPAAALAETEAEENDQADAEDRQDELFALPVGHDDEDLVPVAEDSGGDDRDDAFFLVGGANEDVEPAPALADLTTSEEMLAADDSTAEEPPEEFFALSDAAAEDVPPAAEDTQEELFGLTMEAEAAAGESEEDDLLLGEEYEEESGAPALLFGQDELADPFSSREKETISLDEPEKKAADLSEIFSSLAVVAATLPSTPSGHHLRQVSELAAAARKEPSLPAHQSIILNLLDTAAAMLAKAPQGAEVNGAIVQELASGLNTVEEPLQLAEMISRYTAWQKDFFTQIMHSNGQQESGPDHALQKGFTQLKQELRDEFRQLKQDLLALRS